VNPIYELQGQPCSHEQLDAIAHACLTNLGLIAAVDIARALLLCANELSASDGDPDRCSRLIALLNVTDDIEKALADRLEQEGGGR
jgi:hypothetical protein